MIQKYKQAKQLRRESALSGSPSRQRSSSFNYTITGPYSRIPRKRTFPSELSAALPLLYVASEIPELLDNRQFYAIEPQKEFLYTIPDSGVPSSDSVVAGLAFGLVAIICSLTKD